jgi:hypothetical protein
VPKHFFKIKLTFNAYNPLTPTEEPAGKTEVVVLKTYGDIKHIDSFVRLSDLDSRENGPLPKLPVKRTASGHKISNGEL